MSKGSSLRKNTHDSFPLVVLGFMFDIGEEESHFLKQFYLGPGPQITDFRAKIKPKRRKTDSKPSVSASFRPRNAAVQAKS